MFQSLMDIRKDTPQAILNSLVEIANKASDNRAGKVENTSKMPYPLFIEEKIIFSAAYNWECLHWKNSPIF